MYWRWSYSFASFLKKVTTKENYGKYNDIINEFNSEYYCIAGGFPTKLYLDLPMKYEDGNISDIDIYVLGGRDIEKVEDDNVIGIHRRNILIDFSNKIKTLDKKFHIKNVLRHQDINGDPIPSCIYTFCFELLENPIQFIFTKSINLTEILTSFDNSHNRCGISYKGEFYVTPDAEISKNIFMTYFLQR